MAGEAGSSDGAPAGPAKQMPLEHVLLLATALAGSLLVNLSGQFVPFAIADIAGAIGASVDEGSWLVTVYSMGLFCGVVFSTPLVATFGLRRYMATSSLLFSLLALAAAAIPSLPWMLASRGLQGFVAGGFGRYCQTNCTLTFCG